MPRIRAGKLRQVCDIQQFVRSGTGDRGQPLGSWAPLYASVPCQVIPLHGKQLEITRQLVGTATHKIGLRYLSGVAQGMRLSLVGASPARYFNVGWADEGDFKQHDFYLLVTEQTTGAT